MPNYCFDLQVNYSLNFKKLRWYAQRFSVMSPREIPWRLYRSVRSGIQNHEWIAGAYRRNVSIQRVYDRKAQSPIDLCIGKLTVSDVPDEMVNQCIAEADALLKHRFNFFELEDEFLGDDIDWNRDYKNNIQVPLFYSPFLNHRDFRKVGDAKYIYELNRHQHLVRLGQAYYLTGDEKYAVEITRQVSSWIEQCPFMMGINWTSATICAIRMISWTITYELIRACKLLPDRFMDQLVGSIYRHIKFITKNYSLFSSANNHLITEATGVYIATTYWNGFRHAKRLKNRAKDILIRECLRQNHEDGVNKEQSFSYQEFVFDMLLLAALFARSAHEDFPKPYWNMLEKMSEFIAWTTNSKRIRPHIGDEDGGHAFFLSKRTLNRTTSILNTSAILWSKPEFARWAGNEIDERTLWLLGNFGKTKYTSYDTNSNISPSRRNRLFDVGGYAIFRNNDSTSDEAFLVFDVGPLGFQQQAAHGHADALSVYFSLGGCPILIDAGTYSYKDDKWRYYSRSTGQHNTLVFEKSDQSEYLNRFMWGRHAKVKLLENNIYENSAIIGGKVEWWDNQEHTRIITWKPTSNYFVIEDAWCGKCVPSIRFHLDPELKPQKIDENRVILVSDSHSVTFQCQGASINLESVVISPSCYRLKESQRIVVEPSDKTGNSSVHVSWKQA